MLPLMGGSIAVLNFPYKKKILLGMVRLADQTASPIFKQTGARQPIIALNDALGRITAAVFTGSVRK